MADQTFLFADLSGFTALTEVHGDEHAADAASEFCTSVRGLLEDYDAREVKTIGDALLLRATDAEQAIHVAARIVGDFGVRHQSLGVRIGMHTGPAIQRGDDWFGAAVNVASRIADVARSGEILLSVTTRDAVEQAVLPGQLQPRGRRAFKNVREAVELFALVPEGADGRRQLPVDPVCRMAIDPMLARDHTVYRGAEYHFCSSSCANAFREAPGRYAGRRSSRAALLVSDSARERVAKGIARAYAKGRIEASELEERTERVWSARTRADLHDITHDLPRRRRMTPWLWPIWPALWLSRRTQGAIRRIRAARTRRQLPR